MISNYKVVTPKNIPKKHFFVKAKPTKIMNELMQKIDEYLISSHAYKDPNFSINALAEKLHVHPKKISTTINSIKKKNFNLYINQFRIQWAIKLLHKIEPNNYSIEGIGKEAGFNSKSAFYAAFKKETGTTPIKFKAK